MQVCGWVLVTRTKWLLNLHPRLDRVAPKSHSTSLQLRKVEILWDVKILSFFESIHLTKFSYWIICKNGEKREKFYWIFHLFSRSPQSNSPPPLHQGRLSLQVCPWSRKTVAKPKIILDMKQEHLQYLTCAKVMHILWHKLGQCQQLRVWFLLDDIPLINASFRLLCSTSSNGRWDILTLIKDITQYQVMNLSPWSEYTFHFFISNIVCGP